MSLQPCQATTPRVLYMSQTLSQSGSICPTIISYNLIPSSRNDLATTLRTDCTITRSITDGRALFELAALGVREMRSVRRVLCQMRPPSVTQKRQGEYCSEFEQMLQGEKTMPGALASAMRAQTDMIYPAPQPGCPDSRGQIACVIRVQHMLSRGGHVDRTWCSC